MKVTIGIPHYKAPESLDRLINCLDNQKTKILNLDKDVEIIIVNDDLETVIKDSDFKVKNINLKLINKANEGPSSARNDIIKLAKGDFIFFLDVDCCPTDSWIETMYICFQNNIVDGVGGKIVPYPQKGLINEYYNVANRLERPIIDSKTGEIVTIITANCGFTKKALMSVGGFDQKIFYKCPPGGEDLDLTYRLKQKGFKLGYEEEAVALHEYPVEFFSIFKKNKNYGSGMARYCLARKIDPKSIRQPGFELFSFLIHSLKFFIKFKKSYITFCEKTDFLKAILFSLFDLIGYFAHGYGIFSTARKIDDHAGY